MTTASMTTSRGLTLTRMREHRYGPVCPHRGSERLQRGRVWGRWRSDRGWETEVERGMVGAAAREIEGAAAAHGGRLGMDLNREHRWRGGGGCGWRWRWIRVSAVWGRGARPWPLGLVGYGDKWVGSQ